MFPNKENYLTVEVDLQKVLETFWNLFKQFNKYDVDNFTIEMQVITMTGSMVTYLYNREQYSIEKELDTKRVTDLVTLAKEHESMDVLFIVLFEKEILQDIKLKDDFYGKAE